MRKFYKHSVLNADAFDKRRFNELYNMSKGLQSIEKERSQLLPTFGNLLGDTWSSLYKMNPEFKEDVPESDSGQSFLFES